MNLVNGLKVSDQLCQNFCRRKLKLTFYFQEEDEAKKCSPLFMDYHTIVYPYILHVMGVDIRLDPSGRFLLQNKEYDSLYDYWTIATSNDTTVYLDTVVCTWIVQCHVDITDCRVGNVVRLSRAQFDNLGDWVKEVYETEYP